MFFITIIIASIAKRSAKAFREKVYKATENIAGNKEAYLLEYQKLAAKIQSKRLAIKWFSAADTQLAGLGAETELLATLVKKAGESAPVTDPVVGEKAVYVAAVTGTMPEAQLPYAAAKADVQKKYIDRTVNFRKRKRYVFCRGLSREKKTNNSTWKNKKGRSEDQPL